MPNIVRSLKSWLSGIAQFRHPALVRLLGSMRFEAEIWEKVCGQNHGAKIERGVILSCWKNGQLVIETGATVCRGTVLSFGDPSNGHGRITVGKGTWLGQYNNLRTCAYSDIVIGQNCLVSQFCTIVSSNHSTVAGQFIKEQPSDAKRLGVVLGDDVWLGAGVTVLPGVTIGSGAIIAANSVVSSNVPENEIWAGSPAVHKGNRV